MAYKAKEPILWFNRGDIVDEIQDNWKPYFEEVDGSAPKKQEDVDMDLNNDGVVDKKDKSIAAKVLSSGRKKKSR
ncbi:MAG TPA: hypothetical protein DHN29_14455 [Cytophagales bacterium]|jgi:hypothetical protein|nr:hypothetical protein [Cytophagales bacterium]|tara:strand:+ start:129 stop:353 length:225 start_codon:yes stop_codon:yes gene_type:complete